MLPTSFRSRFLSVAILLVILSGTFIGNAQDETHPRLVKIQVLEGYLHPTNTYYYAVPGLKAGDTLYLSLQNVSGDLDPMVSIRSEMDEDTILASDDDSGQGNDSLLSYTIPADGDYGITVADCCQRTFGEYRLIVGLNAPEVLTPDTVHPGGGSFVSLKIEESHVSLGVEEQTGSIARAGDRYMENLVHLNAGHTLDVFVESQSDGFLPQVQLLDFAGKVLAQATVESGQNSASFEYPVTETGDHYDIKVQGTADSAGQYRLLIGLDAPDVLNGSAAPVGDPLIAEPDPIQIGLEVLQITQVDQKGKSFGLLGVLRAEWTDHKVAFDTGDCECSQQVYQNAQINILINSGNIAWPDFRIANQDFERSPQNRSLILGNDGHIFYEERFNAVIEAPDFDFRAYPFDRQDFWVGIETHPYDNLDALIVHPNAAFNQVDSDLGEAEWVFNSVTPSITTDTSLGAENGASMYRMDIRVSRQINFYLFRVLLPLFLIVLLGWAIFFIESHDARIGAASGNLFVFIGFNFAVATDLPHLGYLTFIEVLNFLCFVVAVGIFALTIYLKRLSTQSETGLARANQIDRVMRVLYPTFFIVATVAIAVTYL